MSNDPLYANLFGERVRVEDVDVESRTAVVERDGEQDMTTLDSLRAEPESIEPGVEFEFSGASARVTETDPETGVIGFETEDGEKDMTLAESVTLEDIF